LSTSLLAALAALLSFCVIQHLTSLSFHITLLAVVFAGHNSCNKPHRSSKRIR